MGKKFLSRGKVILKINLTFIPVDLKKYLLKIKLVLKYEKTF
jgi:hypothetical protein